MSNEHTTSSKLARHELHRAYEVIFGRDPRGAGLILEREILARTFRERAYQYRPDRAEELQKPKRELQEAIKTIAVAFDLLADVVGQEERVWVSPWVNNTRSQAVRPWAPNRVQSTPNTPRRPQNDLEMASQRIKAAISKLKKQTEALAKSRVSTPAEPPPLPKERQKVSKRSLILGRHLHRKGLISLRQLIAAVAWQRSQRPAVGQIAKVWGILTDDQVFEILREKDQGELFCDSAVRRGLMTPFQRLAVVGRQRVMQKPIGQYFIEHGILTEQQVEVEVEVLKNFQREQEQQP